MSFIPPYSDTAAILAARNPLVPRGVIASETDTGVVKVGDGVTRYNSLSATGGAARFTLPPRPAVTTFSSQVAGVDTVNGQMMFISSSGPSLFTSADYGTTLSATRTLPATVNWYDCKKIVAFSGKLYLLTIISGRATIFSTTPDYTGGATWTWTQVHQGVAGATDNLPTCLSTDGTWLYYGEYGDPSGGPQIYRSSDGTTWTSVLGPLTGNRHCHAVEPDPYNAGHVYASFGDGGNKYVMRSTDYGATWTTVVSGVTYGTWAQVVQISFDANRVWFASDDPGSSVYTLNRTELIPRFATTNRHTDIPVLGAVPRAAGATFTDGVHTNNSTTLTSATATFSASDVGRSIFSVRLPYGDVFVSAVGSATSITLSRAATSSGTTTFSLGGSRWPNVAYFGAVDPATGIYYLGCWDANIMDEPTRGAIMYVPAWGSRMELLQSLPATNGLTRWQTFIYGGYVFSARWRVPLLTR